MLTISSNKIQVIIRRTYFFFGCSDFACCCLPLAELQNLLFYYLFFIVCLASFVLLSELSSCLLGLALLAHVSWSIHLFLEPPGFLRLMLKLWLSQLHEFSACRIRCQHIGILGWEALIFFFWKWDRHQWEAIRLFIHHFIHQILLLHWFFLSLLRNLWFFGVKIDDSHVPKLLLNWTMPVFWLADQLSYGDRSTTVTFYQWRVYFWDHWEDLWEHVILL